ncbi:hypothetical protein [Synechococcus sp. RS9916]|uniref:hypothetical protein n=1 Tax=Synechococcus sp. RS9916 TaxID=221359 RepID=UPI0000E53E50|nr:hypothetical protein [Synechococcus sp. RS9916]EAU73486.1 hypothetical protein RS9916_28284 [Synechococcus sp. RS9916]
MECAKDGITKGTAGVTTTTTDGLSGESSGEIALSLEKRVNGEINVAGSGGA